MNLKQVPEEQKGIASTETIGASSDANTKKCVFLSESDIQQCFDWSTAINALRAAYAAPESTAAYPPRITARADGVWLRCLAGVSSETPIMGMKLIAAATNAGYASYLIALFDQRNAELLALMDGNSITGFRTAATTALVADALTLPGSLILAVIGSGFEARNHVRALSAMRRIDQVTVYSPNPESRASFIAALSDLGIPMRAASNAEEAVDGANLILCAARSRDETPTLLGRWLKPGTTLLSIGSTMPEQREIDAEAIRRADIIVADAVEEVVHDTGDMIEAAQAGINFGDKVVSLAQIISGVRAGRTYDEQIIVYKSVGAAVQDITVAADCLERALCAGIGSPMPASIVPVRKWK